MKTIILITLLSINVGCGVGEGFATQCHGELEGACRFLFGTPDDDSELEDSIDEINKRIDELESEMAEIKNDINSNIVAIDLLISEGQLSEAALNTQQVLINSMIVRLVELEGNNTVSEIVDPCGDAPNKYDEVLLLMSSGEYVAYFESGSKRYLTVLQPGNYATTDGTNCNFTINAQGVLQ